MFLDIYIYIYIYTHTHTRARARARASLQAIYFQNKQGKERAISPTPFRQETNILKKDKGRPVTCNAGIGGRQTNIP